MFCTVERHVCVGAFQKYWRYSFSISLHLPFFQAYVGFKPMENTTPLPLATGNWGCGAFGGDPQLKALLQLMASSQARRNVLYLTFGDVALKRQIDETYKLLKENTVNVGELLSKNDHQLFLFVNYILSACVPLQENCIGSFAFTIGKGRRTKVFSILCEKL